MGSPDPRAYSRNKRGIAGSLVWINFDRHALLDLFYKARGLFVADQDEIRPQFQNPDTYDPTALFNSSVVRDAGPYIGATIDTLDEMYTPSVGGWTELATPWYSDQILPFDITLAAANEYGAMAGAKIFGVEILNEGTGVSIDDLVTETQATFVARIMGPLIPRAFGRFPEMPPSQSTPDPYQYSRTSDLHATHRRVQSRFSRSALFLPPECLPIPLSRSHNRATAPDRADLPAPPRQTASQKVRHVLRHMALSYSPVGLFLILIRW